MIPYANPNAYENQLLRDLTSQNPMDAFGKNNVDEYGYRRDQYAGAVMSQQQSSVDVADLSFFYDVNVF